MNFIASLLSQKFKCWKNIFILLLFYFLVVTAEITEDLLWGYCFFDTIIQQYLLIFAEPALCRVHCHQIILEHNSGELLEEYRWKLPLVITVAHSVSHTFSFSKGLWQSRVRYCSSISNSDLRLFWGGSSRTVLCPPV